ncbi:type I polyketide synthase [Phytohabitans flavus]
MGGRLGEAGRRRMTRGGLDPLTAGEALALLDTATATATGTALLVPAAVNPATIRAAAGPVPFLYRGLVGGTGRRTVHGGAEVAGSTFADRLARMPRPEQERFLLDLVRGRAAAVLGYATGADLAPERAFNELGFDSMTAVELRNRLTEATGQRLPTTAVFDYPNPAALAGYLREKLVGARREVVVHTAVAADEPIAIVGMSCRLPGGVSSPADLWQMLVAGADGLSGFPDDRGWDTSRLLGGNSAQGGLSQTVQGGFLHDAVEFDPAFFGISPREALAMDPQQRLLLEASWEAFERAGIDIGRLKGSPTGVFVGAGATDYTALLATDPSSFEGYVLTGNVASVVSGRIAYTFGLEGPAVTVDTACSSSLVALHLAAQALRLGECDLALAGGVTVMSTPGAFVEFSRQGGLAFDGRCKAFAAGADGTGWAEGVGVLVVERLSDARAKGHHVLAVLRGSAVNQDGASNGLTAPNGPSQERVIRQALASARLAPSDVDAVEAHGTGTRLGDPIEAQALLATYGQGRERPLWLGSVKSNIGHTQAAAGVAGVIKMVMAMRHGVLPRTLHVDAPTPEVDWSAGSVELLTEPVRWEANGHPRRAGVSSFGVSGTNAHVIVEEGDAPSVDIVDDPAPVVPWLVSGKTESALLAQASRLASFVADAGVRPVDVAYTLATGRTRFEHRAFAVGSTAEGLRFSTGVTPGAGRLAVVFTGQGSQRLGMGRQLHGVLPAFTTKFDEVCAAFDGLLPRPLAEVMWSDADALGQTLYAQPAIFAVEVALFAQFEAWGVTPDFVAGHSIGQIAASYVSGVFDLADAARLVAARSSLMQALPSGGAMLAVRATEAEVLPHLTDLVSVAAVNGPTSVVVAGDAAQIDALESRWRGEGRQVKRLTVSHAFHSPLMDPMLDDFAAALAGVTFREPLLPFAEPVDTADYWVRHVRQPVRFADTVSWLVGQGVGTFLELGPEGVLTALIPESSQDAVAVASLRGDRNEVEAAVTALAGLHSHGVEVDWEAFFGPWQPRIVDVPTYAFQHSRFWIDVTRPAGGLDVVDSRFWELVGRGEMEPLALELGVPADSEALRELVPALVSWRERDTRKAVIDGWRYEIAWKPWTPAAAPARLEGRWLVAGDPAAVEHLAAAGAEVVRVEGDLTDRDALTAQLGPCTGVVYAGSDPRAVLVLAQALGEAGVDAPLWLLTSGAVWTDDSDRDVDAEAAQVWGLGRVIGLEAAGRWGGLIDVRDAAWDRVVDILAGAGVEDQFAVRPTGVFVRRLRHAAPTPTAVEELTVDGTVVVTGGTGALGGHVARWLAGRGAERLVLTSRRGPDSPGVAELREELLASGVGRVDVVACDVSDRDALAALLADIQDLTGVVHAAGASDLTPLADCGLEEFDAVLAAKVDGARHLDELLADRPLKLFVLFSSIAAIWGSGGQGAYAAANAYLDALAANRAARGLAATSVAWGAWAGDGMAAGETTDYLRKRGVVPLDPATAIAGLQASVEAGYTTTVLAGMDWEPFVAGFTAARPRPLLDDLPEVQAAQTQPDAGGASKLAGRLAGLDTVAQNALVLQLVREQVARVLGHAGPDAVDPAVAFNDMGFDSLTAVELRNLLTETTGLRLPATLVFDYPNAAVLAEYVLGQLSGARAEVVVHAAAVVDEPIAIVGMSCRLPGGIDSPEEFWSLLADGDVAVTDFPDDRGWDLTRLFHDNPDQPGTSYVRQGGFVSAAQFDPGFFGISPREAMGMDPQQRLLLEACWEAVEQAGLDPAGLRGSRTGVFVGAASTDYTALLAGGDPAALEGYVLTGNVGSVISGRVSYTFGLEGPAVTVDTACSSSLVALHLAAQALRQGECTLALAGGVAVMSTPATFVEFSRQRGLAPDGLCKSFAAGADGTAWAEGVGVLVVERLSDARRNGHNILAIVRGSAVNQDGASNGLTAPNGPAQEKVIRQALASADLTTGDVDVVEAHGTGTVLGDPIEAQALLATYGQGRERPLWLGSVKSNLGHTQAAAGVTGIIKTVLAMRHGMLPRTLHVDAPTGQVDWTDGAIELLTEPVEWTPNGRPRRAGISAFGVSGTNAHVILEEGDTPEPPPAEDVAPVVPWLVSAKTEESLRGQVLRLADFAAGSGVRPVDVAYTLATARARFAHRTYAVGSTMEGLRFSTGVTANRSGRLAVVFTGQGSQRLGMGRQLHGVLPVFTAKFDEVCAAFDGLLPRPLAEVMWSDADALGQTLYAQPAIFAVEVALFAQFEAWGVSPDFVAGHSIGQIAASYVSGVFSLEDAARLVAARSSLMQALPAGGAMLAVRATEAEVLPHLTDLVSVAAVNGPTSVVVAGDAAQVEALESRWKGEGRKVKRLTVSHAFHSPLMDPMLDDFATALAGVTFREPLLPFAEPVETAGYWVRHVRQPVRFADTISWLAGQGVGTFLELGPEGVLTALIPESSQDAVAVASLRGDRDEVEATVTALAGLHSHGVEVDWEAFFSPWQPRIVDVPTYAFQHSRFWIDVTRPAGGPDVVGSRFWELVGGGAEALGRELGVPADSEALRELLPALASWRERDARKAVIDGWRYEVAWKPWTAGTASGALTGRWLVAGDPAAVEHLAAAGAEVVRVEGDLTDRDALTAQLGPCAGVVYAGGDARSVLVLAQALGEAGVDAPLWLITSGAVWTDDTEADVNPDAAQVWGLGRVVGLEAAGRWGGLIDLHDNTGWDRVVGILAGESAEDQFAVRPAGVFVRRLRHATPTPAAPQELTVDGTVVVTGGTGALGAHVARWLAGRGVERLVLTSRRGLNSPGAAELCEELRNAGVPQIDVVACDVADRDALAALLADIQDLTGVVHAAGAGQLTPLADCGLDEFDAVLAAKVGGARNLDELLSDRPLRLFVLFSPIAAIWGSGGQGAYAAANAYLDALAANRAARGLAATSVAWGAWAGDGMAAGETTDYLRKRGVVPLDPATAIAGLQASVEAGYTTTVLAGMDWEPFVAGFTAARPRPLLDELPEVQAAQTHPDAGGESRLATQLAGLDNAGQQAHILELVRDQVARVLGHAGPDAVDPTVAFNDMGFDSLTAVELRNLLTETTGLRLPATLVFDYPDATALAGYVRTKLVPDEGSATDPIIADVDKLESALLAASVDDADRSRITIRLQTLMAKWSEAQASDNAAVADRITAASADEIFDFIDRELGRA